MADSYKPKLGNKRSGIKTTKSKPQILNHLHEAATLPEKIDALEERFMRPDRDLLVYELVVNYNQLIDYLQEKTNA